MNKVEEKEKPKEEEKKNNINDSIKNINIKTLEKEKKSIEETKKTNSIINNNKPSNIINKKEEKPKENESKKSNLVSERLKFITGGNNENPSKNPEKIQFKSNNIQNKAKEDNSKHKKNLPMQNNIKLNPKEEPKKSNPFLEKNKIKKEEPVKPVTSNNKFGLSFAEKMKQMNDLFKNQGMHGGQRRGKSVMVPSSKLGFGKNNNVSWKDRGSNNLGIISEEPDKMRPGYDPASNLQKTLDGVVVDKRKRKMTRAVFKG